MSWYRRTDRGWLIAVHAQPGAKNGAVVGLLGESIKIRVAAPALEGKANEALVVFVADALSVPRRAVSIVKGHASREKLLLVDRADADPARLIGTKT